MVRKLIIRKILIHEDGHFALSNYFLYLYFFCVFKIENRFFVLNNYMEKYGA